MIQVVPCVDRKINGGQTKTSAHPTGKNLAYAAMESRCLGGNDLNDAAAEMTALHIPVRNSDRAELA